MRAVSGVNPDVGMAYCQFRVGSSICCSRQYTVLLGQAALTDASRHYARPLVTPLVLMPRADHSRLPKSCADADVLTPISASDTVAHLHELVPIRTSTQSLTLNHQTISGPLQTTPSYYEKKGRRLPLPRILVGSKRKPSASRGLASSMWRFGLELQLRE